MDYDDNFNKAFQEHDLLESQSLDSKRSKKVFSHGDSHCHTVKRDYNKAGPDGKFRKTVTINMYSTGQVGSNIRDAITGEYLRDLVGSVEEYKYFKVVMATGEFKNGPLHLYYSSPEQYERHQYCELDERSRSAFYDRQTSV